MRVMSQRRADNCGQKIRSVFYFFVDYAYGVLHLMVIADVV